MSKNLVFVDLDGTLITGDSLVEGVLGCLRAGPGAWRSFLAIRGGIPSFKRAMSAYVMPDALVVRDPVMRWIEHLKEEGGEVILATGAYSRTAHLVADRLGCFTEVISSDASMNCVSGNKLTAIRLRAKDRPFGYIGNSRQDVVIWKAASKAYIVGGWWQRLLYWSRIPLEKRGEFFHVPFLWKELFRALRPQQWVKNTLVFVPLLAGHVWTLRTWTHVLMGFLLFCALCSVVYIANDLLDVPHDRQHPRKYLRPIARGTVSSALAIKTACVLLGTAMLGTYLLGSALFASALAGYALLAWSYSLVWKRLYVFDIFVLAGLYSLRLYAGSFLANVALSSWLIAVSFFFFLSLACLKRFSSLQRSKEASIPVEAGRAYREEDRAGLGIVGISSALAGVIMLCLYLQSAAAQYLYTGPAYLFPVVPMTLFLFVRIWLLAYRGDTSDDPVAIFVRDPAVYGVVLVTVILAILATVV